MGILVHTAHAILICFSYSLIDLPILVRGAYRNNISAFDLEQPMLGHVDIPRLRKGKVGGFFWYVINTYIRSP